MRILLVNTSEMTGGAAVAASRLTSALARQDVDARLLVRDVNGNAPTTLALPHSGLHGWWLRWAFVYERARIWLANRFSRQGLWAVDIACAGTDITRLAAFREADIIHLHWVNQGLLSLRQLRRILESGKPVVWTMHDMWPCTAICHHAGDCTRFQSHCHDCPQLCHPAAKDLSWQVFEQKVTAYAVAPIHFIGVSSWMAQRARESALLRGHAISVIPNTLPLQRFVPTDPSVARRQLGLPLGARVVVFGAARIDQPIKGLRYLIEALRRLSGSCPELHLLLFGACKDASILTGLPCACTPLGEVSGEETLSRVYSAADVLVSSSHYESFGQTLIEAMACGCTPVAFDGSGQADIIHHRVNGYLARHLDVKDLADGIRWALDAHLPATLLRQSVAERYSEETVAHQHIQLYEEILNQHQSL